jgi:hypothetical protein
VQSPITVLTRGRSGDCEFWPTKSNKTPRRSTETTSKIGGSLQMITDEDAHAIVRTLHLIALHCFDLTAIGRLRLLADQIEQKIQTASVMQTKERATGDQDGATPRNSATREG